MQLDYRAQIWRCLQEHTYARATLEGLGRIFPPIERPAIEDLRAGIALAIADPIAFARQAPPRQQKTTLELLGECLAEVGIVIDDVSPPATPPFGIGIIRFRLANDPR